MPGPVTVSRAARAAQVERDRAVADRLTRTYLGVWQRIRADLDRLLAKMQESRDATGRVPVSWLYQEARLRQLQQQVAQHVSQYAQQAHQQVQGEVRSAIADGMADAHAALSATVPAGLTYSFSMLPAETIDYISAKADSARLAKLFAQFAPDAAQRAKDALIQGVAVGESNAKIAARVRDALSVPLNRAMTIARTETMDAYNQANIATYRANSDVVSGWRWLTGGDPCDICAEEADADHDIMDDPPPAHPNCRCVASPITKSWDDILRFE
jgi:SPP1 gp7 family putative phage head morphogenesis protein